MLLLSVVRTHLSLYTDANSFVVSDLVDKEFHHKDSIYDSLVNNFPILIAHIDWIIGNLADIGTHSFFLNNDVILDKRIYESKFAVKKLAVSSSILIFETSKYI